MKYLNIFFKKRGIKIIRLRQKRMLKKLSKDDRKKIYRRSSLRSETEIESVSRTISFLLSTSASSITGEVVHIDCGTI